MTFEDLIKTGKIHLGCGSIFETNPPPLGSYSFDKIKGMMLGLAIGDALGNTTESMVPSLRREEYGEIRTYRPNRHVDGQRIGLPSDDTQLAFWTLEHLLEVGGLDPDRLAERFTKERIFGIGSTVRGFIKNYKAGILWYEAGPRSAGNGALMRIAPILMPHLKTPSRKLWTDTAMAAMITHNDSGSTASCLAFINILWNLLSMEHAPSAEWWVQTFVETARDLETSSYRSRNDDFPDFNGPIWKFVEEECLASYRLNLPVVEACDSWFSGAFLLETVPSVLYILMCHADDPVEAVVRAVNDTKDNDTIATIVGACVGALHGTDWIPSRWIEGLSGRTKADDDGKIFKLLEEAEEAWGFE